ncbi:MULTISPECIES: DUF6482 family protein [Halomonas]|uniref:Na(+)-translocating NADH-quinone reductase subunit B n=2 Tax=Halomonas TaxID=2745 RepID=A0ABQ0UBC7_9GAMM|nr:MULTISPECIES: DUF6482 family protein [Halomonas]PSJ23153.1 hypothetical protein CVH10_04530 [Halomonas sp. ND22Bw]KGE77800.1 hypothetical protein FP66_07880 [Halomonas salina]MDR5890072.1 DUF6482 family protein [Halomonas salina]RAH38775.1 hypothetical protein C9J49_003790 [Halomonas sp. SL1]WJY06667.1 DUF6482 family protein [Halomonas halophila]
MDFNDLKAFVAQHDNFEIRVISHAGSRVYQVELEDIEGQRHLLTQRGKPMLFRALDDVYLELKRAGIHRAYLVQYVAHDEMIGRDANYHDALSSRMPLVF